MTEIAAISPRTSVSCCMLVKGDEPRFRAAMESVVGEVDEVVCLIDTRSGDANVQLARSLGARVYARTPPLYHGRIDFAAARNAVASHARGDWVFVLDADEELQNASAIRDVVAKAQRGGYDGVVLPVHCYADVGLIESGTDVRAYRRNSGAHYVYPVHNALTGTERLLRVDAVAVHSSYVGDLAGRCERAIPPLLALWGESEAGSAARAHAAFFLCRMYAVARDPQSLVKWAGECERLCPGDAWAAPFWRWYALALLVLEGEGAARACIDAGLARHPRHPDLLHTRLRLDAYAWYAAAMAPAVLPGEPLTSVQHVARFEEAAEALGLTAPPAASDGRAPIWSAR